MECWTVKRRVSGYLDNAVPAEERREMRQHMSQCQVCARELDRHRRIREALASLPKRIPPPDLTLRLRVAASRVQAESAHGASSLSRWWDRCQLGLKNLMRPLALPLAGGLCSAVFLFSALVPTFQPTFALNLNPSLADVPTMLTTEPTVKYLAPIAYIGDATVDVKIDDRGRIVSYAIVNAAGQPDEELRRRIENNLLFTEFWPATAFGKPIAGTIRISFHNPSRIEVKG